MLDGLRINAEASYISSEDATSLFLAKILGVLLVTGGGVMAACGFGIAAAFRRWDQVSGQKT